MNYLKKLQLLTILVVAPAVIYAEQPLQLQYDLTLTMAEPPAPTLPAPLVAVLLQTQAKAFTNIIKQLSQENAALQQEIKELQEIIDFEEELED